MNSALVNPSYILKRLDNLVTLVSVITIPLLFSMAIIWNIERPPYQQLKLSTEMAVQRDQVIDVGVPMAIHLETKRAFYFLTLNDASGSTVYVFPGHYSKTPGDFNLKEMKITVPGSIKPGTYTLQMNYTYWFNPFKDGHVDIELATLVVS